MQVRTLLFILLLFSLLGCGAQAATLNITVQDNADGSTIREAMIYANGEYIGKTGETGTYSYAHSLNESIHLKVTKNGFDDWVNLVSPTQSAVLVTLSRRSESLTIYLYDATTLAPVENALVLLTGEGYSASAATDSTGKASFAVKTSASFNIGVKAQHYDALQRTVQIDTTAKVVQYWLFRSDQFMIQVLDAASQKPVPDASVTLGTLEPQKTDSTGRALFHIDRERKYTITIEKADYQPYSQERLITVEDAVVTALLSKSTYPIFLSVFDEARSPVEGADIYLNDTLLGKSDMYGRFGLTNIEAGPHTIDVRRTGYVSWSDTIGIQRQGEDIVAVLAFGSANLTVVVEDTDRNKIAGATVSVDGKGVGVTDTLGNCVTVVKSRATYNISAAKSGYSPGFMREDVSLGASEATTTVVLTRIQDLTPLLLISAGIIAAILLVLGVRRMREGKGRHRAKKGDM